MIIKKLPSIFLFVILAGCSATSQTSAVVPTINPTVTLFPTFTPIRPTPSLTPTSAPTFTPTATPFPLPARTPLPTLSSEKDFLDFISLIGNKNCKLPCWAGITPGKTNWDEAVFVLHPMQSVAKLEILTDEESIYGKANAIFWSFYSGEFKINGTFLTRSNISLIRMDYDSFSNTTPSYSLPLPERFSLQSVLTEYGVPSMVFIYTFIHDEQGPLPFQILLIYHERQFYIEYHRDAILNGNNVVACDADFYLKLTVVDNKEKLMSVDSINRALETKDLGIQNMKPIEQVLNISPEKFHEVYSSSSPSCITFPTDKWSP